MTRRAGGNPGPSSSCNRINGPCGLGALELLRRCGALPGRDAVLKAQGQQPSVAAAPALERGEVVADHLVERDG